MQLKLLVIRTPDIQQLSEFYSNLGLSFVRHQHGNGPSHYSATIGNTVFEIYPLTKSQTEADRNLRLGFSIDDFDLIVQQLKNDNVKFIAEPSQTEFGFIAIVEDPDGRKIELYKAES